MEVMPTGKKFWRLRYSEDGARRKLTLGQYPAVPLSEARARATGARRTSMIYLLVVLLPVILTPRFMLMILWVK